MSTLELLKEELNGIVITENKDIAYATTQSKNLDFFGIAGASRHNPNQVLKLFKEALAEDFELAILNLFYLRDIRGGLGERDCFRICFEYLCNEYPRIAKELFEFVIEYGRYDDLFVGLKSKVEDDLISLIKAQLIKDIQTKKEDGSCSLLAKWMPSVNASNPKTIRKAIYLADKLGYSKKEYRQMLSMLRKDLIIENNLRKNDYTFDYENVPGKAFLKYRQAFVRNDEERYYQFIQDVKDGIVEMKSKTVYPYEIVKEFKWGMSETEKDAMNTRWNSLTRNSSLENTIVVRDGSSSMTWFKGLPMYIATSMAILCSEQLKDCFKNSFITFSSRPELVYLPKNDSLFDKLYITYRYDDCSHTDIEKVYDLIYKTSLKIKKVIIISDMEFDYGTKNVPTYESIEKKFKDSGIPLPTMVYWNVNARGIHFASNIKHPNVQFVSGASTSVIDSIMNGESVDAVTLMKKALAKYDKIIKKLKGVKYD